MSDSFEISINEWLPPVVGNATEKATLAELQIQIGKNCATQIEDYESKTVRSTIRVPGEPVARWLLDNWWRLRWQVDPLLPKEDLNWALSHSLPTIGKGYVWPDLVFRGSDGSNISIVCKKYISSEDLDFASVRFLNSFCSTISAKDFETGVRFFVERVIARLDSVDIRNTELHETWADLTAEWKNAKLSLYRKIEALLGLDPDENDDLVSSVMAWAQKFGRSALEEISAGFGSSEILQILSYTKSQANSLKTYADLSGVNGNTLVPNGTKNGEVLPWQRAQSLAYALRELWGFGYSPVPDSELADRLSVSEAKLREIRPQSPFSFGYKKQTQQKLAFVLNRENQNGRRFDIARLIGDYLYLDSDERFLPATGSTTVRQKFQRAFAAEFLCPSRMLQDRYAKGIEEGSVGRVVDDICSEYQVAERVVLHHLENRGVLSPEFLESPLLLA